MATLPKKPNTTKKTSAVKTDAVTGDDAVVKKPRVPRKKIEAETARPAVVDETPTITEPVTEELQIQIGKPVIAGGRYVFATGRRKTSVANVRLFSGKGTSTINKKAVDKYFAHSMYRDEFMKPLDICRAPACAETLTIHRIRESC